MVKPVTIKMLKSAIYKNDIDHLILYAKNINYKDLDEAIDIYERFLQKEEDISRFIFKTIFSIKNRRERNKLEDSGLFLCRFEK